MSPVFGHLGIKTGLSTVISQRYLKYFPEDQRHEVDWLFDSRRPRGRVPRRWADEVVRSGLT